MRSSLYPTLTLSIVLLTGCSSDSNIDQPTETDQADVFFFGGVSCSNSITDVAPIGPVGPTGVDGTHIDSAKLERMDEDLSIEVNCDANVDMNIPGPGFGLNGSGSLTRDGIETTISAATADIFDDEFTTNADSFLDAILILHDGDARAVFASQTVNTENGTVYNASFAFFISLSQYNTSTFTGGSFEVIAPDIDPGPNASNFVDFAAYLSDTNGNGLADLPDEMDTITGGNLNITGEAPNWSVTLDMSLESGSSVSGVYNGSFYDLATD